MGDLKKIVYNIILISSLLPVLPFLDRSIPYSLIFIGGFYIAFKVSSKILIFNVLAILFIILECLFHGFDRITDYFILLAGPNVYLFFRYSQFYPDVNILKIFFWLMFLVAIIMDYQSLWGLRGVSGFYNEPSHMGRYLIVAAILIALLSKRRVEFFVLPLILINKSATIVILYLVSLMNGLSRRVVLFGLMGIMFVTALVYLFPDTRFASQLVNIYIILSTDYSLTPEILNSLGSRRLVQSVVGYSALIYEPLGVSDNISLINYSKDIGFDILTVKRIEMFSFRSLQPGSYLSEAIWYFGIPVFLFFTWWIVPILQASKRIGVLGYAFVGVLMIVLLTTSSMLAPWVLLGALNNDNFKERIKC